VKKFRIKTQAVEGVRTSLLPYAFSYGEPVPGHIHPVTDTKSLQNCAVSVVEGSVLLRSGMVTSQQKVTQLFQVLKIVHEKFKKHVLPLRVISCQLCEAEKEWEGVYSQHREFVQFNATLKGSDACAHLNVPMHPLYVQIQEVPPLKRVVKAIDQLSKYLNVECWATYCDWMHEETEAALVAFISDAVEEYPLEGLLKDIHREARSPLLLDHRRRIRELVVEMGKVEESKDPHAGKVLISLEKELIVLRGEVQRFLLTQCMRLGEAVKGIEAIKAMHPELIPLKVKMGILKQLMEDQVGVEGAQPLGWAKQAMLLQLLDEQFQVIPVICGWRGLDRTGIVFALRMAIMQLRHRFSFEKILDLATNWEHAISSLNSEKSPKQTGRALLAQILRQNFLANLVDFSLPIVKFNANGKHFERTEKLQENHDLLELLPPKGPVPIGEGEFEVVPLVKYDTKIGKALGLTKGGHRLLQSLIYPT